jgi:Peptidase S46
MARTAKCRPTLPRSTPCRPTVDRRIRRRTDRYRLADELQSAIDRIYPTRARVFNDMLAIIDDDSKSNPDIGVKYANSVAGMNNAMKYFQGSLEGLARSNALAIKRARENALDQWLAQQPKGGALDGPALRQDMANLRKLGY